jgi:hypothetical protein
MTQALMAIDPLTPALAPVTPAPAAVAATAQRPPVTPAPEPHGDVLRVGAEPPEDALAAVQVASQAYEVLRRTGRELRFTASEDGIMRIEVYDGTGRLVRSIPPNEALALASGEASWRA